MSSINFEQGQLRKIIEKKNTSASMETLATSLSNLNLSYSFRLIELYPTSEELTTLSRPDLKKNIIKGPYISTDHYLDIHFQLLREDFVNPLRQDVCCYLKNKDAYLQNIKMHEVMFFRKGVKLNHPNCYCLEIKGNSIIHRHQKRFMIGSILIFTNDCFKTIFCGKVANAAHVSNWKQILVSFEHSAEIDFTKIYSMVEYNVFFEPYYNVLKVLQNIAGEAFPMEKYLIEGNSTPCIPKYLDGLKYALNDQELNPSQLRALNSALSQELVIIQGPPGTGKTYLGLKIAKALLATSKRWYNDTPMLVVAFTNHALDQFLEGLMDTTNDILRFGGRSKNPKITNFTMREKRKEFYRSTVAGIQARRNFAPYFRKFRTAENQVQIVSNQIDNIITSKPTCIFYFSKLSRSVGSMHGFFTYWSESKMISWLLEDDGSICGVNNNKTTKVSIESSEHKDANKVVELWEDYLKKAHKGSSYCMVSVSIMAAASEALNEEIKKCAIETKKLHQELKNVNQNLRPVHQELKNVNQDLLPVYRKLVSTEEFLEKLKKSHEYLQEKIDFLKLCLKTDFGPVEKDLIDKDDPFKMPVRVRWQLYKYWLRQYETRLRMNLEDNILEAKEVFKEFAQKQDESNLDMIKRVKVVGMTTTCASRMRKTLEQAKCPIVIVEEAAEVLESHIISVLTEHCQHLVMIGDHLQLKPTTSDYEIETRYKLGVSLFERMVNNDMECHTLNVQHRMRPEISRLITPSVYPVLYDHDSVKKFPEVRGVQSSVFFIEHKETEQSAGGMSKKNVHEAEFLVRFAMYLLQNGYKPEEITILAAYLGQVTAMQHSASRISELQNVKITSVDNFQGEENKIILLSLVRNNLESRIGFLSTENRVCVALSRAKEGLYVMGNMSQLSARSKLWQKVFTTLESMNAIGSRLPLKCRQHNTVTLIKCADDFDEKVPEGGCKNVCGAKLISCNHLCKRFCHNDDGYHFKYKCLEPCGRLICKNKHRCPSLCNESCRNCHKLIIHQFTECGHKQQIECYKSSDPVGHDLQCHKCDPSEKSESETEPDDVIDFNQSAIEAMKKVCDASQERLSNTNIINSSDDEKSEIMFDSDFDEGAFELGSS